MRKQLVLIGGGHTHLEVLRRFAQRPEPGVQLTLLSPEIHAPYSGMLPGLIAGHYRFDETHVDLRPLCHLAGARLVCDEAVGLDLATRHVLCRTQPALPYDVLSLNIGSTPRTSSIVGAAAVAVPIKPIAGFVAHWHALRDRVLARRDPVHLAVVGTGAGGVEILLAMQYGLHKLLAAAGRTGDHLTWSLLGSAGRILPGYNARTRRLFEQVLHRRGVRILLGQTVGEAAPGHLLRAGGQQVSADEVLWVLGAGAAPWLTRTGLALDPNGFLTVDATLESLSHPGIFAAGDVASVAGHPRPKSGVFAVRQGPPLTENLRRSLQQRPLRPFHPQHQWLSLITTGNRYAIASRGRWTLAGAWAWHWKRALDRHFMDRYQLPPGSPSAPRN